MKQYRDNNDCDTNRRRKKPKRRAFRGLICCCQASIALAGYLAAEHFPFTGFNPGLTANAQSSTDETAWYLILANK